MVCFGVLDIPLVDCAWMDALSKIGILKTIMATVITLGMLTLSFLPVFYLYRNMKNRGVSRLVRILTSVCVSLITVVIECLVVFWLYAISGKH